MSFRSSRNLLGVAAWLAVIIMGVFGIPGVRGVLVVAGLAGLPGTVGVSAFGGGVRVAADAREPRQLIGEARQAHEARQVDRAEALFREALKLAEAGGPGLAREQAEALLGVGQIELESDRRTAAKGSLDRAVTLFETAGDPAGQAQALAAAGQARVLLGDAAEGVRRVQTAVETLRARVGATRGDGARGDVEALARASAILISVMPPGPAKDTARDAAFAAARASSSRGHECAIRHAWGGDLLRAGDYAEAWRGLTEAVACYEGVPDDRRLSHALLSLGSLKRTHGQFDAALVTFERALAVSRERRDPVGTVLALNAVGTAHTDLWHVDEARAALDEALALARERKMEWLAPYMVGQVGAHLTQIEKFAEAIPLLEESLALTNTVPRQIERLTQLCAARARAAGAGAEGARAALPVCDRNVALARGDSPTALLYALRARAEARRRAGAVEDASTDLREAVDLVEDLRGKTVPIDFMKRGFSAWHEWLFGSSIALSIQQGDTRQALETAERARSRALLDLLATREVNAQSSAIASAAARPAGSAAASANANAAGAVKAAGTAAAAALPPSAANANLAEASAPRVSNSATSRAATGGTVTSNVASSGAATADAAHLNPRGTSPPASARRTAADLPRLDSSTAVRAATVPDMIATARRLQSTLLVYWITPDAVFIWTIAPDGAIHDARVDVPMAKVIGLVAATRAPASQDASAGLFALKATSSRRPWRELHDLLIAPVRAHLPKTSDALITIVPHGPLAQLSFAALQDEQGSYLLERYTLHYTPAVGVLAYTAKHREERLGRQEPHQPQQQAAIAGRAASASTRPGGAGAGDAPAALLVGDPGELPAGIDGTPLSALPWARREVTEVAALLGGNATVLTDAEASEAAVRERLTGRAILHFATHGVVREDETLGSFLALRGDGPARTSAAAKGASASAGVASGAVRSGAGATAAATVAAASDTDGRLTADEVYELKLDADLVVLSACSSALGPTGTEGVIGFTRAFLYAGAASVIATSWNVPDASSYELMSRFYRERARRDTPATARTLRAAQLSTLAALRQGKVTVTTPSDLNGRGTTVALPDHPLFWAGFIVVGEP